MTTKNIMAGVMLALIISAQACKPKEQESELITTVTLTLQPSAGGTAKVLQFKDTDGDGATAAVITGDTLAAGTVYNGSVAFANESVSPAEDITAEVISEAADHQVFYAVGNAALANIVYGNGSVTDAAGLPVGNKCVLTTSAAGGATTLKVTLRHEPNKSAANVAQGDITNAGGETDVEVSLPVNIK